MAVVMMKNQQQEKYDNSIEHNLRIQDTKKKEN
jgi:hypothetical protein